MKENSWLLTINCSTNHANLLVIVVSHGSLTITNPWLQEIIQSMAQKIVFHIQTHTFHKASCKILLDHQNQVEMGMNKENI